MKVAEQASIVPNQGRAKTHQPHSLEEGDGDIYRPSQHREATRTPLEIIERRHGSPDAFTNADLKEELTK